MNYLASDNVPYQKYKYFIQKLLTGTNFSITLVMFNITLHHLHQVHFRNKNWDQSRGYLSVVPGVCFDLSGPVLHSYEWIVISDVIHEDKAHSTSVISGRDCTVALLSGSVLQIRHHFNQKNQSCHLKSVTCLFIGSSSSIKQCNKLLTIMSAENSVIRFLSLIMTNFLRNLM